MAAPTRTTGTRQGAGAILIVLALGLAFRLILAYVLPDSGFANDLASFRGWADDLARNGLAGFYDRPGFHDYTPGYLYVLWLIGVLGQLLGGIGALIKLPAIVADVVLAWLAWSMTRELGAGRRAGLIAAAIIVVNPITWFDSVAWGQVDSVGVVFLLLGVRELWRDRPERSAVFTVIAAIVKPQLGILVPIVAAVTIRRALRPVGGYGDDPAPGGEPGGPPGGRTTLAWERRVRGPVRIVTTGLAGFLTAVALSAPFGLSIVGLAEQVASAAGGYPYLSVNAYNPWALASLNGAGIAASGQWVCDMVVVSLDPGDPYCPEAFQIGPFPAVVVGTALLLAVVAVITLVVARRPDRRTLLVGVSVLALAFFIVPTRVHERYLFPFYALAAVLAAVSLRWRIAYLVLGLATFANMYVVLTTLYPDNGISDFLGIGGGIREPLGVTIVALLHLAGFVWAAAQLRDGALARLASLIAAAAAERTPRRVSEWPPPAAAGPGGAIADWSPASPGGVSRAWSASGSIAGGPATAGVGASAERYRLPAWRERPSFMEVGWWGWLRSRLLDRPIRPDRTAALQHEGGGRLDRLDLWFVVVLVVAVLTLRVWRLAEPYQMHFDEVYHARTATEFLQFWRYGMPPPEIYEWTHPHLAKYAIAGGIVAFGEDRVGATSQLGVPVRDAVVEDRWVDSLTPKLRLGDRLHVATGSQVRSYDLRTRALVATADVAGARSLAVDASAHRLFVGTEDGQVFTILLDALDAARAERAAPIVVTAESLVDLETPVHHLHVTADGTVLVAAAGRDAVALLDPDTGAERGRAIRPAVTAISDAGSGSALVTDGTGIDDPASAAAVLAGILGGEAADYESHLGGEAEEVVAEVPGSGDTRKAVDTALDDGRLAGMSVQDLPRVATADSLGVALISIANGSIVRTFDHEGGAGGLALVEGVDDPKLYVARNGPDGPDIAVITVGGAGAANGAFQARTFPLPGAGEAGWVGYDRASQQVHVLARPPTGRPADQVATVYVIEPHANAFYADAPLPFRPAALALDANEQFMSADREQMLVLSADGATAQVDAGQHAFSWRMPGVLAGAAMAALLYLLTRILFRRRSVAVLAGVLTLVDGMFFVQSRIAMNDAYVALFIVAAYTLFAALWVGAWRWRGAFWVAMPAIGVLLGLALAAKWVAAYAIGALGILILARSALGRVVLIAGLIVATTVLGYMAMSVPPDTPDSAGWQLPIVGVIHGNLTFTLIMVGLTVLAAVVTVLHPIAWTMAEVRIAIGGPFMAGTSLMVGAVATGRAAMRVTVGSVAVTPVQLAFALVGLSLLVAATLWAAGRLGFGPLAPPPAPDDPVRLLEPPAPPPRGWLRPGWMLGLPVAWMAISLVAIPVAVYVVSYIPWAFIDNQQIAANWPNGHTGQSLLDLTGEMYRYHNTLTEPHAASSPWWAWPFDLKPVWFYQEFFADGTAAAIYDAGNIALWWLGVPAMAFCAWQAFKRRSLGLALIAIAFACQWVAWARIDRAAFQYHYYTALPFVVIGLAYFLAELWQGASRRTWLLARLAAAAAVIGPAAMWLLHRPLCGYVRVTAVNPDSQACPTLIPEFVLTGRALAMAVVVGLAVIILVAQFVRLDRRSGRGDVASRMIIIGASAGGAALALLVASSVLAEVPILVLHNIAVEPIAIVVLLPLLGLAAVVATARDARRFVVGAVGAIVATFVVFYPNIAALPLPSAIFNAYQGFLPTYVYPFQFPVSTVDRSGAGPSLIGLGPAVLLGALTMTCLIVAYGAWSWRIATAERLRPPDEPEEHIGPAWAGGGR